MRCSVVTPSYQNHRTLPAFLRSFTVQQRLRPIELIVVDDGSDSDVAPLLRSFDGPVSVRLLRTQRAGQSAATNAGLAHAKGEVVLLTCADIVASPTLIAEHVAAHVKAQQEGRRIGVGGHIVYAPWIKMTPFMRFLAGPGPQFDFTGLTDGEAMGSNRLYAPNFSALRDDLWAVGGFDAGFPYGFQDTDLGLRLYAHGVRLQYGEKAVALHDHPTTFAAFLRRNRTVGGFLPRMLQRYPDPGMIARCRNSIDDLVPLLPRLPQLVEAATAVEAQAPRARALPTEAQTQLFALYDRALGLALLEGLIGRGTEAARALGYTEADWHAALARGQVRGQQGAPEATC